ncbi:UNVERIFIED_CONTAM: hypothetical protein Sradi_6999700 [Sesamum radiatum]|uniref:Endonuclease/exonuclease/phosphatase domain-containing protein n=1 Tax=Sesamum radiatum TaxID=300843 RepID=A0AAW2JDC5_SESRA
MISIAAWNVRGLNSVAHQHAVNQLVRDEKIQFLGILETRVQLRNVQSVRARMLPNWSWFDDYSAPGGRIWLAWNALEIGVEVLLTDEQFIHCRLLNKRMSTTCLISVVYGYCDPIPRRQLWGGLHSLSDNINDNPWCVLGDFNAIIEASESCGNSSDSTSAMADFRECILNTGLAHIPFTGCPFTWHNCSEGARSLWRRLDRILVNANWLCKWPQTSYVSVLPRTSDHSPIILTGEERRTTGGMFRFDNFLAGLPGFRGIVRDVWRHQIHGTRMYGLVCKLKALKGPLRALRKAKGDLSDNVRLAKEFLDKAQGLFERFRDDTLFHLVHWCRVIYCKTVEEETLMLRQRAKMNWSLHGDQCSKLFFSKINTRRASQRVYQITTTVGVRVTEPSQVAVEFLSFFQNLLGGVRQRRQLNLEFLQPHLKHRLTDDEANALLVPVSQEKSGLQCLTLPKTVRRGLTGTLRVFSRPPGRRLVTMFQRLWRSSLPRDCFLSSSMQRC